MRYDIYYRIKNKLHTISIKNYIIAYTQGYGVKYSRLGSPYVSHRDISYIYPHGKYAEGDIYFPEQKILIAGGTTHLRGDIVLAEDKQSKESLVWEEKFPSRFILKYIEFIISDLGLEKFYKPEYLIPIIIPTKQTEIKYLDMLTFTLHDELLPPAYRLIIKN